MIVMNMGHTVEVDIWLKLCCTAIEDVNGKCTLRCLYHVAHVVHQPYISLAVSRLCLLNLVQRLIESQVVGADCRVATLKCCSHIVIACKICVEYSVWQIIGKLLHLGKSSTASCKVGIKSRCCIYAFKYRLCFFWSCCWY